MIDGVCITPNYQLWQLGIRGRDREIDRERREERALCICYKYRQEVGKDRGGRWFRLSLLTATAHIITPHDPTPYCGDTSSFLSLSIVFTTAIYCCFPSLSLCISWLFLDMLEGLLQAGLSLSSGGTGGIQGRGGSRRRGMGNVFDPFGLDEGETGSRRSSRRNSVLHSNSFRTCGNKGGEGGRRKGSSLLTRHLAQATAPGPPGRSGNGKVGFGRQSCGWGRLAG